MMIKNHLASGTAHKVPDDLRKALMSDSAVLTKWNDLTPLARNEWICWVTFVKQDKTRAQHIARAKADLKKGKRRPCCWIGCIHRKDKELSPSIKAILGNKKQKSMK